MTDEQTVIPPARPQRPNSIRNLVPRLPISRAVKIGGLGETRQSKSGRAYQMPVKYSSFKIVTLERGPDGNFVMDKALHDKLGLGDEPTEIPIRLLFDDPELSFMTRYAAYQGTRVWCSGDGVEAYRSSKEHGQPPLPEPFKVQCPCHRQDPGYKGVADKCKINGRLQFLIDGAGGVGGVAVFRTTSFNTVTGIASSLALLRTITGGVLANIPLKLRIQPKQAQSPTDGSSVLIYVVSVEFGGDIGELQHTAHQIALDRATTHISIERIEDEARRYLALPHNAILPGDDAEAIQEEFYPEASEEMLGATPPPRPTREQFETKPGDPPHDPTTGEIIEQPEPEPEIDPTEMLARSLAAAREGIGAFRAFWAKLSKPERAVINDDREKYQRIAEKADEARKAEAELAGDLVQDEPGSIEPDYEVPESTWLVPIPRGKDGKTTDWPALRDALVSAAEGCESVGDLTAFEEANKDTIEMMKREVAVYANTVVSVIAACRQRFGAGGGGAAT